MREFWTLFKYEFKTQTPFLRKKGKSDFLGGAFILLIVAVLVVAAVIFLSQVVKNYLLVEINKVAEPVERAKEILSVLYFIVLAFMTILMLERTRKVFLNDKNNQVFLRLPIKRSNVFLSKFAVILIHTYIVGLVFVFTVNCIVANILPVGAQFWLASIGVAFFMPILCLLAVAILIVPYVAIIEALSNRYLVLFILFTVGLGAIFIGYSLLLKVVQTLLTTGSIRFLFNEGLVGALQGLYHYGYPVNALVSLLFEKNTLIPYLILLGVTAVSVGVFFLTSKRLYKLTLFRQPRNATIINKRVNTKQRNPVLSLMRKEFICVYREPDHVFSYFSMAMSMPIMVYCSFTLFDALIYNALGIHVDFSLAITTILMFSVLTNTFCSTNFTRDGLGMLKMKTLPLDASKIFLAKVLFCAIVSSIAVLLSCITLVVATNLGAFDGFMCFAVGIAFSFSQIFVATRVDLNHAKISMNNMEVDDQKNKTLSKVVLIGGALTVLVCLSSIFFAVFAGALNLINNAKLLVVCTYAVPVLISIIYLVASLRFFRKNISKKFENLAD